jgi:hypothetical protein
MINILYLIRNTLNLVSTEYNATICSPPQYRETVTLRVRRYCVNFPTNFFSLAQPFTTAPPISHIFLDNDDFSILSTEQVIIINLAEPKTLLPQPGLRIFLFKTLHRTV